MGECLLRLRWFLPKSLNRKEKNHDCQEKDIIRVDSTLLQLAERFSERVGGLPPTGAQLF